MADLLTVLKLLPSCWGPDTAQLPPRLYDWHFDLFNPAQYQCSASSLLIREFFGGRVLTANIGPYNTKHYWNDLDGMWLDATRSQFGTRDKQRSIREAKDGEWLFQDTWDKYHLLRYRLEGKLIV